MSLLGNPSDICGFIGGSCIYRITISVDAWHRLVTLSMEGVEGIPDWIDLGNPPVLGRRLIATSNPSYFYNQQEEKRNANTQRDQAGPAELQGSHKTTAGGYNVR